MDSTQDRAHHQNMVRFDGPVYKTSRVHEESSLKNHISADGSEDLKYSCPLNFSFDHVSGADDGIRAILQSFPPYRWELVSMSILPLYRAPSAMSTRGAAISPSIRPPGLISSNSDT